MGGHHGAPGVTGRLGVLSSAWAFGAIWSQPILLEAPSTPLAFALFLHPKFLAVAMQQMFSKCKPQDPYLQNPALKEKIESSF